MSFRRSLSIVILLFSTVAAQTLAETDKKNDGYQHDLLMSQTTRPQILRVIAWRDTELALEYFYKTRADFSIFSKLAANDFDRARKLIDDFTRRRSSHFIEKIVGGKPRALII